MAPLTLQLKGEMPVTLQSFIILFCTITCGWRIGGVNALLYVVAGIVGLPVFSNYSSGIDSLTGLYGGFFFGFVFAAFACGFLAEQKLFQKQLAAVMNWMLGHIIILAFGFIILIPRDAAWQQKLELLWPGALIKSVAGALIIQFMVRLFGRKNKTVAAFSE
ncbi:MAG: biotin transporter BioY [Flavobacteriales bacterium]